MKGTGEHTRTFHIDVTTKPKRLCAKDPNRTNILVKNEGTAAVYITSAKNLAYTDGIELEDGDSYRNNSTIAEMWILTASGAATVKVQIDGD